MKKNAAYKAKKHAARAQNRAAKRRAMHNAQRRTEVPRNQRQRAPQTPTLPFALGIKNKFAADLLRDRSAA